MPYSSKQIQLMAAGLPPKHARRVRFVDRDYTAPVVNRVADDAAELLLYSEIGFGWDGDGMTAREFDDELKALGDVSEIRVRINSPGGDVFDGLAIFNVLRTHPATITVEIDGVAASIASVIAMAGDSIRIHESASMMIHKAWAGVIGNAADMLAMARVLEKIDGQIVQTYVDRSGGRRRDFEQAMAQETWYGAEEAVRAGLADSIIQPSGGRSRSRNRMSAELARRQRERRNRRAALDQDSLRIAALQRDALNRRENPSISQQVADRVRQLIRKVNEN